MDAIFLPERCLIKLTGSETKSFLQGLITNDIEKLGSDSLQYSLLLTPQGKFLYDFFIFENDGYYLDILASRKDEIIACLKHYRMRSKIEVVDLPQYKVTQSFSNALGEFSFKDPRHPEMGYRNYVTEKFDTKDEIFYHQIRLKIKLPEAETELESGKAMALEYGLDNFNAVAFDKGCYVGQELMARTHFKGVVRKRLYVVTAKTLPAAFTEIYAGDKRIGVLGKSYENRALALIRTEDLMAAKESLMASAVQIKVEVE